MNEEAIEACVRHFKSSQPKGQDFDMTMHGLGTLGGVLAFGFLGCDSNDSCYGLVL